ncbi:glycine--tRNA ligase subunit beta [Caminibacter mediatlanticus TB-2]|uniref:Glycine--tRNA ligase beta subunit n=1 Tax=Caminibacter mediatlanticus TB-2 TaxID=391592 RepID=A0ABX5V9W4_9BACT|nr:glycine--tRNA ligase subunit beta [Caminibacter mediatlanticus]QCT95058.1 glycine--tRNA ligase subunit beta [Caminibacter mediatlanticus TB-2]
MNKPLLVEIGVEELPAIPFLNELPNIEKKWLNILEEYNLKTNFEFFYTPRRLVLWHREFPIKQEDIEKEIWGAPKSIVEKNKNALLGFAKKNNINVEDVQYKEKNGQEFLYYKTTIKGKESKELLPEMVEKWLKSLNFGKTMKWGRCKEEFIRPIRWILCMLEDEAITFKKFCTTSSNFTLPHRVFKEKIFIDFVGKYFCELDKKGVIVFQKERKEKILREIKEIEKKEDVKVEIDNELLDEIVAITEYPTALIGKFDEEFLALPQEVIITSMKEHQRYFPVYKNNRLTNAFIVVSNAFTDNFEYIIKGNEKVLRARLSDAMFFYKNDLKNGLSIEGLKNIVFMDKLGSLYDKVKREEKIGEYLADEFNLDKEKIKKAINLAKADLLSEMVYEFTELQGIMGYYYALAQNEDKEIAIAIKEQYTDIATNKISAILNISKNLDTILGLFSIGKIPKGNKDPFGLRRAANHIIKIAIENNIPLDIKKAVEDNKILYNNLDTKKVIDFIFERLYKFYDVNPSVIRAVLNTGESNLLQIDKKIKLLNEIVNSSDFKDLSKTFKRVANIVKGFDLEDIKIEENLFKTKEEKELYEAIKKTKEFKNIEKKLDYLISLKPLIDKFFDNVLVNVEDEKIRNNRKSLIASIYKEFLDIADIKEISL